MVGSEEKFWPKVGESSEIPWLVPKNDFEVPEVGSPRLGATILFYV